MAAAAVCKKPRMKCKSKLKIFSASSSTGAVEPEDIDLNSCKMYTMKLSKWALDFSPAYSTPYHSNWVYDTMYQCTEWSPLIISELGGAGAVRVWCVSYNSGFGGYTDTHLNTGRRIYNKSEVDKTRARCHCIFWVNCKEQINTFASIISLFQGLQF